MVKMNFQLIRMLPILCSAVVLSTVPTLNAATCPLCPAIGAQTISEQYESSDAVLIAELIAMPPKDKANDADAASEQPGAESIDEQPMSMRVLKVFKGETQFAPGAVISVPLAGEQKPGTRFFLTGIDLQSIVWNSPLAVSDRAIEYLGKLFALGYQRIERLDFFQQHLESTDPVIAQDAYDEFARAPYADVVDLKEKMDHAQVVRWIKSDAIPSSRRRLFFMMLGVCGSKDDLPMLEQLLREPDPLERAGIDATIACYLTLGGETGLPLVEDLFLKNQAATFTDVYGTVMAIRFHGTEGGVISPEKLTPLLHHLLDRPRLADLVIADLARWEDWTVLDRLVALFKESDGKSSWVRVPIMNYLKVCPLPEAAEQLEALKAIDPDAFRRSNVQFPFGDAIDS
jgi:hypothetical protein